MAHGLVGMAAAFQLLGGHAALDLVNSLDNRFAAAGPLELLPSYADLLRFAHQSQVLSTEQAAGLAPRARGAAAMRVLQAVRELREALAVLLYREEIAGNAAAALATIQRCVLAADAQRVLVIASSPTNSVTGASWSWDSAEQKLDLPLWILAKSVEELLTGGRLAQVRSCERETCSWLFLDSSKNHSRRWCDMKVCGNRVKAQRYHAKHRV
jgi:predicted RNA-binding Zn ribbon-like protein